MRYVTRLAIHRPRVAKHDEIQMSLHWTYREVGEEDLLQGDILERTDALIEILRKYHPYFCREEYTGFLVLTQSCDLVRDNKGECKAPYISIAVIRELEPLLPELLSPICGAGIDNVYLEEVDTQHVMSFAK